MTWGHGSRADWCEIATELLTWGEKRRSQKNREDRSNGVVAGAGGKSKERDAEVIRIIFDTSIAEEGDDALQQQGKERCKRREEISWFPLSSGQIAIRSAYLVHKNSMEGQYKDKFK